VPPNTTGTGTCPACPVAISGCAVSLGKRSDVTTTKTTKAPSTTKPTATTNPSVVIDGVISAGEWTGATTVVIGNGGGQGYIVAAGSYLYAAFDVTGWTSAMGASSQGNLLGFGVWKTNGGYGTSPGVEFQQSTTKAAWGGDGPSGSLNGLESAWRISTVLQVRPIMCCWQSFHTTHHVLLNRGQSFSHHVFLDVCVSCRRPSQPICLQRIRSPRATACGK
jgi:hypothetical protein